MANAAEALGEDVREKAAHELVGVQRHRLGLVLGAGALPPKADAAIVAIEKTAVGDGDAMRVATEISRILRRARRKDALRRRPRGYRQGFEILRELGGVAQSHEFAVKHNAASVEGRSQTFEKQATIAAREKMNGEKEVRLAFDPAPVRSEAAARHDAVNMV